MNKLTRKELAEIIGEKTLSDKNTKKISDAVASYFASDQHDNVDFESLMRDVMQYRQDRGYIEATAVSAHPLGKETLNEIRDILNQHFPDAKSITVNQKIDDSIIGGVRLDLPMESLDLSIRSKLNTFKRLVAEERN